MKEQSQSDNEQNAPKITQEGKKNAKKDTENEEQKDCWSDQQFDFILKGQTVLRGPKYQNRRWTDNSKPFKFEIAQQQQLKDFTEQTFNIVKDYKDSQVQGIKVNRYKFTEDFFQIFSKHPIPDQGRHRFGIHVKNTQWNQIDIGVAVDQRKWQQSTEWHSHGAIVYNITGERDSLFADEEDTFFLTKPIDNGNSLDIVVDQDKEMVEFYLNGNVIIAEVAFPNTFNGRDLHPFVSLWNKEDEVVLKHQK